jgi:hypothetical protein
MAVLRFVGLSMLVRQDEVKGRCGDADRFDVLETP